MSKTASSVASNLVIARIPDGWRPEGVRRALVPIRGGPYSALRARLLASLKLRAAAGMEVIYLIVLYAVVGQRPLSFIKSVREVLLLAFSTSSCI